MEVAKSAIGPIFTLITTLYGCLEGVEANKERCEQLKDNVKFLERVVRRVREKDMEDNLVRDVLTELEGILKDAVKLVEKQENMCWLKRVVMVNCLRDEFDNINKRLEVAQNHLNTSLQLEKRDQQKQRADLWVKGDLEDMELGTQNRQRTQSSTCPITLVLVGEIGTGKSASGNTILGENKFASRATADPLTIRCQKVEGDVYGTKVTIIDTPDFFDQDLEEPERHVRECRAMCEGRECVYLLVIQIGCLTEEERDILERLEKKLGKIRDRTIILFTYGDDLKGQSIDDYVKNTNPHLQWLIRECANRYHVFNNKIRDEQQVKDLMEKISRVPQ